MQVSQVQALGEELLREPVKRVNNVSKLLTALGGAKCDEVCPQASQLRSIVYDSSLPTG